MPRKRRALNRDTGVLRDASLVVIASEDTYAVKQYFERMQVRRVQVEVIATDDCRSSPKHVMKRLDDFRKENATEPGDQFWVCIDKDRWAGPSHIANLVEVLRECRTKGYSVTISSPCFELWLLLHFEDVTADIPLSCKQIVQRLRDVAGGYAKNCCARLPIDLPMVHDAVSRAANLDTGEDIPPVIGSRVYKIVETIGKRESLRFS